MAQTWRIQRCVEADLGLPHPIGIVGGDAARYLAGGIHQRVCRYHLVHQVDSKSLIGIDDAAREHQFARNAGADDPWQQVAGTHVH